ncbi:unnamed protein product [Dracunculus medinensis]|uniref:Uncharacterized protein n=1 Tax=Dracunculus medinensis TaxID=318479 RepID=A0A0N4U8S5_DRAME|nr:unnamed protein product [Dracunculus medinensis]
MMQFGIIFLIYSPKNHLGSCEIDILQQPPRFDNGERLLSITPCAYPIPSNIFDCGISDIELLQDIKLCDPDQTISMSEVEAIKEKLEKINSQQRDNCVCKYSQRQPCWYRFGFAFIRQIFPVETGVSHLYRESLQRYGDSYARILRERWAFGECDEDILFLIVQKRSQQYIFASFGALVIEELENEISSSLYSKHNLDQFQKTINKENDKLKNGYPLKTVIEQLLDEIELRLTKVEQLKAFKTGNHIPNWAIAVFVVCALLCLLMTIGLCLVRTSVRRGAPRAKGIHTTRRWKAGFICENLEGNATGVNLMQMMLPPSRNYFT